MRTVQEYLEELHTVENSGQLLLQTLRQEREGEEEELRTGKGRGAAPTHYSGPDPSSDSLYDTGHES